MARNGSQSAVSTSQKDGVLPTVGESYPTPTSDKTPAVTRFASVLELDLSIDKFPRGYKRRRIDTGNNSLSQTQRKGLYALLYGLMEDGATLENGAPITSEIHAVQWLLEQVWKQSDMVGFPESLDGVRESDFTSEPISKDK